MGQDDDIHDTTSKRYKAMLARHAEYRKQKAAAKKAKAKKRKPVAKKPAKAKKTNKSKKRK